ncbi:acyltransferase family protein [Rufibacter roseus]|nr:acyltransferase [Rufibacter roseus]
MRSFVGNKEEGPRVHSLDYLRGMMAFMIMIYHYLIWVSDLYGAETFFGRIGVYGVSIFYIISGMTLCLVYKNSLSFTSSSISSFFIRRFFRIYPLLWVSMLLTLLLDARSVYSNSHLFLSLTGLFGFVDPTKYIGLVTWSIGNELVFYSLFPLLIILFKKNRPLFFTLTTSLVLVNFYYTFFVFDALSTLHVQWGEYVNPLNHIMLFVFGVFMGLSTLKNNAVISNGTLKLFLLLGVIGLFFYPVSGDLIKIIQGWERIFLVICSCIICFTVYNVPWKLPNWVHLPLSNIGKVSYSIYLLHPICFMLLIKLNNAGLNLKIRYLFVLYVIMAFGVSNLFYYFFERPFVGVGRRLTDRKVKVLEK